MDMRGKSLFSKIILFKKNIINKNKQNYKVNKKIVKRE